MPDSGESPRPQPPASPEPRSDGKSIWELRFLSSLLIPILAGTIGWGLWQLHVQNRSNQQNALDQQRATILQTYIDNMRDLLLNHNLTKSAPGDEVRQVARVQTLNTLRSLDAARNIIVLQFLHEAHLVGTQDTVINLSNADLSKDDLSGANLSGIDLDGATLTGAHLNGADLNGATLFSANLGNADLSDANLSNATLTSAFLGNTIMNRAALTGARLNGAVLANAQLHSAHLSGADLNGADLTGTDLSSADLSDADLIAPGLTQQQLDTVHSCTNAQLKSTGLICNHQPSITLTYWYTETSAEAGVIGKLIGQFEQQYPEIHINPVNINYFQTQTAFAVATQEGNPPDVLRSDASWVAQFASQGNLLNIDSYVPQGDLSDYLSAPLSYDYYQGHLYGLPQVTDFLALLYNRAMLERAGITSPPATMTDLERDAEKVKQQTNGATYGFETDGTSYNVLPFFYAFGGGMFDQHGNILVKSNGSVKGLEFLLQLQNADKVMPTQVNFSNGPLPATITDFRTGRTAMIFGGPYDVPEILTNPSFKSNPGNLGIAGIPTCPAGTPTCHAGQTGTPVGGQSYVVSAGTKHPLEAYRFISFMSSTASQIEIAETNHTLPTRHSAYQDRKVSSERVISAFLPIARTAVPRPAIPQAGYLFDAFDPRIAAALDGVQSPIAALSAVADAWKQLLAGL